MDHGSLALAAAACLALVAGLALLAGAGAGRARFFTLHSLEEPTRPYQPYTGTPAFGPWGAEPWAEAAPRVPAGRGSQGPRPCP
jgi:hypothetical protein